MEKEVQANLDARLAGQSNDATSAWKSALSLAATKGFSYVPAADLAKGPLHDIINRLEALPAFHNSVRLCCTNRGLGTLRLSPDGLILRALG